MQTLRLSIDDADKPIDQTAAYRTTVGMQLSAWTGQGFEYRIAPGDLANSAIYYRMTQRGDADQMPPVGSAVVDDRGLATVRELILSLSPTSR